LPRFSFSRAQFSGSEVSFTGAGFSGGEVDFSSAETWSRPPVFDFDEDRPQPGVRLQRPRGRSPDAAAPPGLGG
jgi:hypothetical protein